MGDKIYPKVSDLFHLRNRAYVFEDRDHAGRVLAGMLEPYRGASALVLGVPAGGVPIAIVIARALGLEMDVAVVSKITLPWNTEVGYGAVAFDGTMTLNEEVLPIAGLSERQIAEGIEKTRLKVARRVKLLRGDEPMPTLAGRTVIVVDDGLATGSTLQVAVKAVKNAGPASVVVAVPTGHQESVMRLAHQADAVFCANVRSGWRFAVADAYRRWTNIEEDELAALLADYRAAIQKH